MNLMKLLVVVFSLLLVTSGLAWGVRGPSKVSVGFHNLSATAPFGYYKTNVDAICVFCHTPHGGTLDGPLWNRGIPDSAWQHYNSATLSTHLKGADASRAPNPVSMLCLSCHDGSLAVNHVINEPNNREGAILGPGNATDVFIQDMFGMTPASRIGGDAAGDTAATGVFTDDHPFSFSYDDVMNSPEYDAGNAKENTLKSVGAAEILGVRFFAGPTGTNNVECSSCHDPHVNYDELRGGNKAYAPFLITPNTGSALCLACHTK
jgi:hypothetical protein